MRQRTSARSPPPTLSPRTTSERDQTARVAAPRDARLSSGASAPRSVVNSRAIPRLSDSAGATGARTDPFRPRRKPATESAAVLLPYVVAEALPSSLPGRRPPLARPPGRAANAKTINASPLAVRGGRGRGRSSYGRLGQGSRMRGTRTRPSRWPVYLCQAQMPLYVEPVSRSRAASALASPRVRTSSFRRIADTW